MKSYLNGVTDTTMRQIIKMWEEEFAPQLESINGKLLIPITFDDNSNENQVYYIHKSWLKSVAPTKGLLEINAELCAFELPKPHTIDLFSTPKTSTSWISVPLRQLYLSYHIPKDEIDNLKIDIKLNYIRNSINLLLKDYSKLAGPPSIGLRYINTDSKFVRLLDDGSYTINVSGIVL